MVYVDLSKEEFNSVAITFKGVQYKLFHGDEIDNPELVSAFPQYFNENNPTVIVKEPEPVKEPVEEIVEEKPAEEIVKETVEEPKEEKKDPRVEAAEKVTEEQLNDALNDEEDINFDIKPEDEHLFEENNEEEGSIEEIVEEAAEEVKPEKEETKKEPYTVGVKLPKEEEDFKNYKEKIPLETPKSIKDIIIEELDVEKLFKTEAESFNPNDFEKPIKIENNVETEVKEKRTFGDYAGIVFDATSNTISKTITYVMSLNFITIISMLMIAASAIFFDLEGWVNTYSSIPSERVVFMVVSLYVAKLSIIKILSVAPNVRSKLSLHYLNHLILRVVLISSLLGMIFVSAVGIYSSLAVNTMADVKATNNFDDKKASIERKIKDIDTFIDSQNKVLLELPENFATSKRKVQASIEQKMELKYSLIDKLDGLTDTQEKKTEDTHAKSINFTADLLGMDNVELLKYINILLTLVLELTYVAFETNNYKDGFGNPDAEKLYQEVLRKIVDVNKNFAVMMKGGRLDVLPKDAEEGDNVSGPTLAKTLLPKVQKAVKGFGISAEILNIKQSPKSIRQGKPLYGAIKLTWN
jgi:hypothetical protein